MEHLFAEGLATPINVISQQSTRDGCRKVGEGKIAPGLEFPLRKSNVNDIHGAELNHYPHPIIAREGWPFLTIAIVAALVATQYLGGWSWPFWVIALFVLQFFRDPARALPDDPSRVFLAIGKQTLDAFATKPQHQYLLRLVDPPEVPPPLPQATVVIDRGPFDAAADTALLRDHAITNIVAKNAGGAGAEAKLIAARALRLPVILIDRLALPPRRVVASVEEVMAWLAHTDTDRGV